MTAAGATLRAGAAQAMSWRDAGALFAAVVITAVAVIGPVAGAGRSTTTAWQDSPLPSDVVNVALRQAAVELRAIGTSRPAAQRAAVAAVVTDTGVQLQLVRGGAQACVQATHSGSPRQVWSYAGATGAIATQPC